MKLIKTNYQLLNFKGEPLKGVDDKEILLGVTLANVMSGKTSNHTLAWILGKKLATEKQVELKAEEVVFVKGEVIRADWMSSLMKGQILEILDSSDKQLEDKKE